MEQCGAEREGVAAAVHLVEERLEERDGGGGIALHRFEEVREAVAREEIDVLGEHAEETAREKGGDGGGVVFPFEKFGELGEVAGDFARDGRGNFRWVERERVEPDGAELRADRGVAQIGEADAIGAGIGEREVGFALLREVGVELEHVADIDDEEKRRRGLGDGEIARVVLGLAAGLDHRIVPRLGAAGDFGFPRGSGVAREGKDRCSRAR